MPLSRKQPMNSHPIDSPAAQPSQPTTVAPVRMQSFVTGRSSAPPAGPEAETNAATTRASGVRRERRARRQYLRGESQVIRSWGGVIPVYSDLSCFIQSFP